MLYTFGLLVGRFQLLHSGHVFMIQKALGLCDNVIIFVGSANESGTSKNPFSYELRKKMIEDTFEKEVKDHRLFIYPLKDIGVGDNSSWGKYILEEFKKIWQCYPDVYISGTERIRASWFTDDLAPRMDELRISRAFRKTSASECRKAVKEGNYEYLKHNVPNSVLVLYNILRENLERIK